MSDGWIKLHRKLLDWEWFTDTPVLALFIYLVVSANHKPKKFRGHEIERGQTVIGLHSAAERTGLSPQKVRTALKKLKSTGEITSKSTNKFTIITICNYEKYQIQEGAEQQALQQTNNKPLTTNKKERKKEVKKRYGENNNVLLLDEQYDKLKQKFNGECEERIDRLSLYLSSSGRRYKCHYSTILSWARKDQHGKTRREEHDETRSRWAKELLDAEHGGRGDEAVVGQIQGSKT